MVCKLYKQNQSINALFPQMINIKLHKDEEKLKDFQALFINSSNLRLFIFNINEDAQQLKYCRKPNYKILKIV